MLRNDDGKESLERVEDQCEDAESLGSRARDIGGSDVAASCGSNIFVTEDTDEKIPEGNGAEEIGDRDGKQPGGHGGVPMVESIKSLR